jgi:hypothetical protein
MAAGMAPKIPGPNCPGAMNESVEVKKIDRVATAAPRAAR